MIDQVNKAWGWKKVNAIQLLHINLFGNIIFETDKMEYWRICPEELSCEKITNSKAELEKLFNDEEFLEDWQMLNLVEIAKSELGILEENQKYCLKIPAILGGNYEVANFGKISFSELILASGNLAYQIKDVKEGEKIKLLVKK